KKIPDIVKYEAKQQIPFPLDEVIWDFQQMAGGSEEDGFALETEVGLFAMKRDQVYRSLEPFRKAGIEVDLVQLASNALYNFAVFDQMPDLPPLEAFATQPQDVVVLLSMGTDATDFIATNGYRVWFRSIPLGGNHFTKALMKEFDLTFAKAEHLKRNATTSTSPKAVFQAMKPIFADLVTQVERSIQFYSNVNREAKIKKIIGLGNVMKLPGIRTYLQQSLGSDVDVVKLENFARLEGASVVLQQQFKDNILAFAPCYGLCVQGAATPTIRTNLVPQELVTDRIIRAKKPWAVAAAAALLLGYSLHATGYWRQWSYVHPDVFNGAQGTAKAAVTVANDGRTAFETRRDDFFKLQAMGEKLTANTQGRLYWLELLRAIDVCLPHDPGSDQPIVAESRDDKKWWEMIRNRNQIYISQIDAEYCKDLAAWYPAAKAAATNTAPGEEEAAPAEAAPAEGAAPADGAAPAEGAAPAAPTTPTGEGWIIQLTGHHFHNPQDDPFNQGREYLLKNFVSKLKEKGILLQDAGGQRYIEVGDLGIMSPLIVDQSKIEWEYDPLDTRFASYRPLTGLKPTGGNMGSGGFGPMSGSSMGPTYTPDYGEGGGMPMSSMPPMSGMPMSGMPGGMGMPSAGVRQPGGGVAAPTDKKLEPVVLPRYDFIIQFIWQETPPEVRKARRDAELKAAKEAEEKKKSEESGVDPNTTAAVN
ncbi:MAG TPA: pilus assembly protein PilM, partial [Pirellulales bacterium]